MCCGRELDPRASCLVPNNPIEVDGSGEQEDSRGLAQVGFASRHECSIIDLETKAWLAMTVWEQGEMGKTRAELSSVLPLAVLDLLGKVPVTCDLLGWERSASSQGLFLHPVLAHPLSLYPLDIIRNFLTHPG